MPDTRNDTTIPVNTWVDLYTTNSITVGTGVTVFNKGNGACFLCISASTPPTPTSAPKGVMLLSGNSVGITPGASGLWAYKQSAGSGYLLVQ